MVVLGLLPPVPKQRNTSREFGLIGNDRPTFAKRTQILAGIKAEAAEISDRSRAAALVFCAMRLRSVLDDDEVVAAGNLHNGIHVSHQTMQMDRHDRLCPRSYRTLDQARIHCPGDGID